MMGQRLLALAVAVACTLAAETTTINMFIDNMDPMRSGRRPWWVRVVAQRPTQSPAPLLRSVTVDVAPARRWVIRGTLCVYTFVQGANNSRL